MKQWATKQTGFTIVELLIVIVVIAILAAITIVSYNGIQNRANDSAVQSDLKQFATKVEMFRAEKNIVPRGEVELASLDIRISKSAHGTLWVDGTANYNFLYCSPDNGAYTVIARSKSGKVFRYGTTGVGEFTLSSTGSSDIICSNAGVPIPSATGTNRTILYYGADWLPWVKG